MGYVKLIYFLSNLLRDCNALEIISCELAVNVLEFLTSLNFVSIHIFTPTHFFLKNLKNTPKIPCFYKKITPYIQIFTSELI